MKSNEIPGYLGTLNNAPEPVLTVGITTNSDPYYWDHYAKTPVPSTFDQYQKFQQGIPQIAPYNPLQKSMPVSDFDYDQLFKQMSKTTTVRKTALEELMEDLFDMSEKEQFLIECGYEIHEPEIDAKGYMAARPVIKRKLADGTYKTITNTVDELFLIEAKIKLKNLLLAKATLKFKFK